MVPARSLLFRAVCGLCGVLWGGGLGLPLSPAAAGAAQWVPPPLAALSGCVRAVRVVRGLRGVSV